MTAETSTVPFADFAEPIYRLEDVMPEAEYRLLGMRSGIGGPFLRETKLGGEVSATRLNRVRSGDFIYSRLFAWQGSFGLIPPQLDGCYVSNEFPLFLVDRKKALPEFLVFWFGLPHVQKRVEADCTGSTPGTRNRYREDYFLRLHIDLPSLHEQQRIVSKIAAVAARIDEAKRLRQEIQDDANALLHSVFHRLIRGAEYRPLAEVAPIVRRPVEIELEGEYPELGVRSFGKGVFHKPTLQGAKLDWQKLYRIHAGDLVISNIKAWEGAIAVAGDTDHGRVGSHRYITCVPKAGVATANFVCFYLLTPEGLEQIGHASPGSADRNRTLAMKRLEEVQAPVPDMHAQQHFSALLSKVAAIRYAQADSQTELDALLPAVLDKAFRGEL